MYVRWHWFYVLEFGKLLRTKTNWLWPATMITPRFFGCCGPDDYLANDDEEVFCCGLMWVMRWYWSDLALPAHYWLNISSSSSSYHHKYLVENFTIFCEIYHIRNTGTGTPISLSSSSYHHHIHHPIIIVNTNSNFHDIVIILGLLLAKHLIVIFIFSYYKYSLEDIKLEIFGRKYHIRSIWWYLP